MVLLSNDIVYLNVCRTHVIITINDKKEQKVYSLVFTTFCFDKKGLVFLIFNSSF